MEKRPGNAQFFFANQVPGLDAIFEYAQHRCKHVFQGQPTDRHLTPETIIGYHIQQQLDGWFDSLRWLADSDPVKMKVINDGPIIDFFILLDEKIKHSKAEIKRIQKSKK